nr:immunoglobulin heavy chain junction region [Macaca mulatta]
CATVGVGYGCSGIYCFVSYGFDSW